MLRVAKEKSCYQTLLKLDLTKTLPYLDNTFDNILCVGSTTYLGNIAIRIFIILYLYNNTSILIHYIYIKLYSSIVVPSVLEDWIRVTKKNGMISFTHKTKVWKEWESTHDSLEKEKKWKRVWISEPLYYLPSYKGYDLSERVKVYIYQKL